MYYTQYLYKFQLTWHHVWLQGDPHPLGWTLVVSEQGWRSWIYIWQSKNSAPLVVHGRIWFGVSRVTRVLLIKRLEFGLVWFLLNPPVYVRRLSVLLDRVHGYWTRLGGVIYRWLLPKEPPSDSWLLDVGRWSTRVSEPIVDCPVVTMRSFSGGLW